MPLPQGYYGRPGGRYNDRNDNQDPNSEQFCKLFIGGLNFVTDEKSMRNHFEQYGEIIDCIVMKDSNTKKSRGFGFITYKKADQLEEAQKNRPHKLDDREVETKRAMPRDNPANQQSVKKMFVGGLKDDTTEEMVRETFPGKIEKLEMIKDKGTGKSRGFCFVTFDDADTVDKFVLKQFFELNGRKVEVKKAVSKEEVCHNYYGPQPDFYGPGYGMGGGGGGFGYRPGPGGPNRGAFGGNYGNQGGYGNQGWNQGNYGDYGYGNQGWGGQSYYGPGPMKGGRGYGGNNYNRR